MGLFKGLLGRVPWDRALEQHIPTKRKSGKDTRRLVGMNKYIMNKHKKEAQTPGWMGPWENRSAKKGSVIF